MFETSNAHCQVFPFILQKRFIGIIELKIIVLPTHENFY